MNPLIVENLLAVKSGAMWRNKDTGLELLQAKLIRVNKKTGWYDLTAKGREILSQYTLAHWCGRKSAEGKGTP